MKIFLHPNTNQEAVKYVFTTIFEDFLGLEINFEIISDKKSKNSNEVTSIYYGPLTKESSKYNFTISANELWAKEYYRNKKSLPKQPLKSYSGKELPLIAKEKNIPIIYMGNSDHSLDPYFKLSSESNVETNIDFIASIFFLLTSYQEVIAPQKDKHERYPAIESLAYHENFINRPLVNEYIELLFYWLKQINPKLKRKERQFQLFLTHDIDNIRVYTFSKKIKRTLIELVRNKSIKGFFGNLGRTIKLLFQRNKDPIKYIIKQSNKFGFKSYFFFLTTGSDNQYDRIRYDINSEEIKKIFQEIEINGHEIGLHSSYNSFLNKEQLVSEKNSLTALVHNKKFGIRSHYLRFKIPESYSIIDSCDFTFDSTLAFADRSGFRAGVCYPFQPFNIISNKKMNFTEYPLIIMDTTLTGKNYQNIRSKTEVLKIMKEAVDKIAFYNGYFVLLMHNISFEDFDFPWRKIYEEILRYCQGKLNK
ncbi:MAG: polysaccharide deacetylase family protein [Candidatus Heimdallarchaeota archaeon]